MHLPCSVLIRLNFVHTICGRSKPGALDSGFPINMTPRTPESLQRVFHISDKASAGRSRSYIGCLGLSLFWGCLVISPYSGRSGFLFILSTVCSACIILRKSGGAMFASTDSHCTWVKFTVPVIIRMVWLSSVSTFLQCMLLSQTEVQYSVTLYTKANADVNKTVALLPQFVPLVLL